MSDAEERLAHGRQVLDVLYPGDGSPAGVRRFAVAPSLARPRLLLPTDAPVAARAALRAYGGRLDAKARYAGVAYRALVRASPGRALRPTDSAPLGSGEDVEAALAAVLGYEIRVAIHLTPARANRKPVLQVLEPGRVTPVGFAKLAASSLTAKLLAAEAAALQRLDAAPDLSFRVPPILHQGEFRGQPILVTGALATWQRGRLPRPRELVRVASEIAALEPIRTVVLRESTFWNRLHDDLERIADPARRARLATTVARVGTAIGDRDMQFGVGHGDFSPWNMWFTGHRLLIWDWERLSSDVPVGADLVHYKLQDALTRSGTAPAAAAVQVLAGAPDPVVAILHLLALAVRYAKDDQAGAGAAIGDANDWLLPAIDAATDEQG